MPAGEWSLENVNAWHSLQPVPCISRFPANQMATRKRPWCIPRTRDRGLNQYRPAYDLGHAAQKTNGGMTEGISAGESYLSTRGSNGMHVNRTKGTPHI